MSDASSDASSDAQTKSVAPPQVSTEMNGPGIWEALAGDPTHHLDRRALGLLEVDTRRWSARWIRVPARLLSRLVVGLITVIKRVLPFEFSNHDLLDRLGIWFLRRCVSEEGGELLLRHFAIETDLLAFIATNAGLPVPDLRPTTLDGLADNAVIVHDLNVYELLAGLANRPLPQLADRSTPLDYTMLGVPEIDVSGRRFIRLDLETSLACMNIAFALLTTSDEYRRAVHSLQLDESLLVCLTELTGDDRFLAWRPTGHVAVVRTGRDVPQELFGHALINEYAHARLLRHVAADPMSRTDSGRHLGDHR